MLAEPTTAAEVLERAKHVRAGLYGPETVFVPRERVNPKESIRRREEARRRLLARWERDHSLNTHAALVEMKRLDGLSSRQVAAVVMALGRASHDTGISVMAILGSSKEVAIVRARMQAMGAVARALPELSLKRIGGIFARDHTTVLSNLRRIGVRGVAS